MGLGLERVQGNFFALNVDSMAFSVILGFLFCFLFIGREKATTKNPGKLQPAPNGWSASGRFGPGHVHARAA